MVCYLCQRLLPGHMVVYAMSLARRTIESCLRASERGRVVGTGPHGLSSTVVALMEVDFTVISEHTERLGQ